MSGFDPSKHQLADKSVRVTTDKTAADRSIRITRRVLFHAYNPYIPVERTRRRLPHWTQSGATYFITFRLGDSIPWSLLKQWAEEREIWLRSHPQPSKHQSADRSVRITTEPWSVETQAEYAERFGERLEEWLDRGFGECHLRWAEVRAVVQKHLLHFDAVRYDMDAYVLMPNHVHVLLHPREGHELFDLLQGIKGTSARTCNKLLARKADTPVRRVSSIAATGGQECSPYTPRTGTTFWMEDSYNRLVRDAEELFAYRRYIAGNPSKAKLKEDEYTLALNDVLYVA